MKFLILALFSFSISPLACDNSFPSHGPFYVNNNISSESDHGIKTLKVVTFNIAIDLFFKNAVNVFKNNDLLASADIVLLQETTASIGSAVPKIKKLAEELNLNYAYSPAIIRKNDHQYGNAILSKWPLRNISKALLPESSKESCNQRISLQADILINNKKVSLSSVHLSTLFGSNGTTTRNDQVKKAFIKPQQGSYSVIGGDFNTFQRGDLKKIVDYAHEVRLKRVPNNSKTFILPTWKLDHIFYKGFQVIKHKVVYQSMISDHYPLYSELKMI